MPSRYGFYSATTRIISICNPSSMSQAEVGQPLGCSITQLLPFAYWDMGQSFYTLRPYTKPEKYQNDWHNRFLQACEIFRFFWPVSLSKFGTSACWILLRRRNQRARRSKNDEYLAGFAGTLSTRSSWGSLSFDKLPSFSLRRSSSIRKSSRAINASWWNASSSSWYWNNAKINSRFCVHSISASQSTHGSCPLRLASSASQLRRCSSDGHNSDSLSQLRRNASNRSASN